MVSEPVVDNRGSSSNDSNNISSPRATLPADFCSWKKLDWAKKGFGWQWELLRFFFANKGYILYVYRASDPWGGLKPEIENDPPDDNFGLLGVRTNFWPIPPFLSNVRRIILHIHFESYSITHLQRAEVWGARDMSVACGLVRLIDLTVTS
jgi:hypothetical protein